MAAAGGFQLVEHIRRVEGDRRIEATTTWTEAAILGPAAFLLEALSQAAGWLIAAASDFALRGLPLTIGTARLLGEPPPGATVDLVAEITGWRDRSAQVGVRASCGGRHLCEAAGGICGLVGADQLEAPAATRAAYAALRVTSPGPSRAPATALEPPGAAHLEGLDARGGQASWLVAGGDGLFADHFPRFPVLPGALLVQGLVELAQRVAAAGDGLRRPAVGLRQVRFRRPVRPGDRLTLEVEAIRRTPEGPVLTARALVGDQRAATIGEIVLGPAG